MIPVDSQFRDAPLRTTSIYGRDLLRLANQFCRPSLERASFPGLHPHSLTHREDVCFSQGMRAGTELRALYE